MTVAVKKISAGEDPSKAARELLFKAVKEKLSLNMREQDIVKDESGKPYDKSGRFFFSLSHSGDTVAVLIASSACGIDVQKITSVSDRVLEKIGAAAPFPSDDAIRTALWALAESYVKMTGEGISGISKVPQFAIAEIKNEFTKVASNSDKLFEIKEIGGYVIAVCIRAE